MIVPSIFSVRVCVSGVIHDVTVTIMVFFKEIWNRFSITVLAYSFKPPSSSHIFPHQIILLDMV